MLSFCAEYGILTFLVAHCLSNVTVDKLACASLKKMVYHSRRLKSCLQVVFGIFPRIRSLMSRVPHDIVGHSSFSRTCRQRCPVQRLA